MEVKKTTFAELDKICKPECIFASNTSSLSITEIGNGLTRPMVGMHFFNPADRMKLVEVIAGGNTPDDLVEKIKGIATEIGKTPVQVAEAPGFAPRRESNPFLRQLCRLKNTLRRAERALAPTKPGDLPRAGRDKREYLKCETSFAFD